jgi:hypothetical protein
MPQKCGNCWQRRAHSAVVPPREVLPMSEVIPFQKRPTKSPEEETAEFLKLLERIRSEGQKKK